jgi:hypothetical protein
LFIRRYTLNKYYTFQDFVKLPTLPSNIIELGNWLDTVSYFKRCLDDVIKNQELITSLGYEKTVETNEKTFIEFLENLTTAIKTKIEDSKLNGSISEEKVGKFLANTNEIISSAFTCYDGVFNPFDESYKECKLKLVVSGSKTLMSKSAFTDNDIPHLNYDTVFAETIATQVIHQLIPNSFSIAKTKRYLLNLKNIVIGLDKILQNQKDYVIVGFRLSYMTKNILQESRYKNSIVMLSSAPSNLMDVLFVMKKSELPSIERRDLRKEEKEDLQLVSVNTDLQLYASVIDLNLDKNKEIKDKWSKEQTDNDDLKVQIAISFLSVMHWKDERNVIQVNIASEYREHGIQNEINEIEPIK